MRNFLRYLITTTLSVQSFLFTKLEYIPGAPAISGSISDDASENSMFFFDFENGQFTECLDSVSFTNPCNLTFTLYEDPIARLSMWDETYWPHGCDTSLMGAVLTSADTNLFNQGLVNLAFYEFNTLVIEKNGQVVSCGTILNSEIDYKTEKFFSIDRNYKVVVIHGNNNYAVNVYSEQPLEIYQANDCSGQFFTTSHSEKFFKMREFESIREFDGDCLSVSENFVTEFNPGFLSGEIGDPFNNSFISVNMSQLTPFHATDIFIQGNVQNYMYYHIHDNSVSNSCETRGGHFAPFNNTWPPDELASQYQIQVGDLSSKHGFFDERGSSLVDVNLPLSGINSVNTRSFILHAENGDVLTCFDIQSLEIIDHQFEIYENFTIIIRYHLRDMFSPTYISYWG